MKLPAMGRTLKIPTQHLRIHHKVTNQLLSQMPWLMKRLQQKARTMTSYNQVGTSCRFHNLFIALFKLEKFAHAGKMVGKKGKSFPPEVLISQMNGYSSSLTSLYFVYP
ncbi:hypothetical protein SLEP1_g53110 [Rubroshorea leprosula]|uniref:Uncharacterized protein n=1 Tax=Rubroshorea leprosula TaxID=152421 RepID=A0AAV5MB64_9ROSI|nr:hypothetical protein SLEP1_g53110 [Rubroshorea leprosula]